VLHDICSSIKSGAKATQFDLSMPEESAFSVVNRVLNSILNSVLIYLFNRSSEKRTRLLNSVPAQSLVIERQVMWLCGFSNRHEFITHADCWLLIAYKTR